MKCVVKKHRLEYHIEEEHRQSYDLTFYTLRIFDLDEMQFYDETIYTNKRALLNRVRITEREYIQLMTDY